ncbi:lipocalin family protein [Chitinophaga qingshengii]|uniref:Lipocalin family protein n=1 Tax=Chitinophaga qingshengii TaxID=1569794 RepID=A0ABR7TFV5_9BACT|nr:lipocalin family protein [Chitinophaga qingshengii]MBC9929257.1 lipocalin family protein [Chitinophaga qingshengii]
MKTVFCKSIFTLVMGIAVLSACDKSDGTRTKLDGMKGNWELSDLTLVNDQKGTPRQMEGLETINYPVLNLNGDGSFSAAGKDNGKWNRQDNSLSLSFSSGRQTTLKVARLNENEMVLEQAYAASGNKSGGVIYYQYVKK